MKINTILKYIAILFLIVTSVMVFVRRYNLGLVIYDIDEYIYNYNDFLAKGFYTKVAEGTSVLYYVFIYGIQNIFSLSTKDSFLVTNILSQVLIAGLGSSIILSLKNKGNKLIIILSIIYYSLLWLNDEQYGLSRNDLFLGVLAMLLYRVLLIEKIKYKNIYIGVVLALMFSIRSLTLILIPSLMVYYIVDYYKNKYDVLKTVRDVFISFFIIIVFFHFPSIIENHQLSFYDKNKGISEKDFDWNDINTLATLRMFDENKMELMTKNMYWGWNKEKVDIYKEKYNIKKSPKNFFEFLKKYPIYYFKLFALNTFNVVLYVFRRYAFFIFLPLIFLFKNRFKITNDNISFIMFITTLASLLIVVVTVIEMRWLITFEFLFFLAIIQSYINLKNKKVINYVAIISFVLLIVFNVKTLSQYV